MTAEKWEELIIRAPFQCFVITEEGEDIGALRIIDKEKAVLSFWDERPTCFRSPNLAEKLAFCLPNYQWDGYSLVEFP